MFPDRFYTLSQHAEYNKSDRKSYQRPPVDPPVARRLKNVIYPDSCLVFVFGVHQKAWLLEWQPTSTAILLFLNISGIDFPFAIVHGDRCCPWYCAGDHKAIIVKGHRSANRNHGTKFNSGKRSCFNWFTLQPENETLYCSSGHSPIAVNVLATTSILIKISRWTYWCLWRSHVNIWSVSCRHCLTIVHHAFEKGIRLMAVGNRLCVACFGKHAQYGPINLNYQKKPPRRVPDRRWILN